MALESSVNPRGIVIGILDYVEQKRSKIQSDVVGENRGSQRWGASCSQSLLTLKRELELLIFN